MLLQESFGGQMLVFKLMLLQESFGTRENRIENVTVQAETRTRAHNFQKSKTAMKLP